MAAYTLIVARKFGILVLFGVFASASLRAQAQQQTPPPPPPPAANSSQQAPLPDEGNIPEEDETEHKETEYHFNPIRAKQEFDVGIVYSRTRNKPQAAAKRFREATLWNPGYTEAYLKLGEMEAKLNHKDEAHKAFAKVIQLAPDSKQAKEAKKLTAKL
jgi:tetratricopeptide (TPR) repeat protein